MEAMRKNFLVNVYLSEIGETCYHEEKLLQWKFLPMGNTKYMTHRQLPNYKYLYFVKQLIVKTIIIPCYINLSLTNV